MCSMSVVMDYGRKYVQPEAWKRDSFEDFKEILRRLDKLDAKLGQPECHDPEKAAWMKAIEERLSQLEATA